MRASRLLLVSALAATLALGCSAVIDPDPSQLGDAPSADMGPTECAGGCDDGVACTRDQCVGGRCLQATDDSLCADGERCDSTDGCVPNVCTTDDDCGDDGVDCNGVVTCGADGTCRTAPGTPCPDDGDPCTSGICDPGAGGCVSIPLDADGDGAPAASAGGVECAGGTDCDDGDGSIRPGASETCDGVDQDCDGAVDEGLEGCMVDGGEGNTCDDPIVLSLSGGSATWSGSLAGASDDFVTACTGGGGHDRVFAVDFTGIADIAIETVGSTFDTVLAASTSCGDFTVAGRGCNDDIDLGVDVQSRLWVHRVGQVATPNRLYIVVEGYGSEDVGQIELSVQVRDAASDGCAGPLDISGGGSVLGWLGGAESPTGSFNGDCLGFPGSLAPEGVFELAPERRRLRVQAWSDEFSPDLYVKLQCNDRNDLFCEENTNDSGLRDTTIDQDYPIDFTPRDVNVFVDGGASGDAYTLDYQP